MQASFIPACFFIVAYLWARQISLHILQYLIWPSSVLLNAILTAWWAYTVITSICACYWTYRFNWKCWIRGPSYGDLKNFFSIFLTPNHSIPLLFPVTNPSPFPFAFLIRHLYTMKPWRFFVCISLFNFSLGYGRWGTVRWQSQTLNLCMGLTSVPQIHTIHRQVAYSVIMYALSSHFWCFTVRHSLGYSFETYIQRILFFFQPRRLCLRSKLTNSRSREMQSKQKWRRVEDVGILVLLFYRILRI